MPIIGSWNAKEDVPPTRERFSVSLGVKSDQDLVGNRLGLILEVNRCVLILALLITIFINLV